MATNLWASDAVQFPRLLAEIVATQTLDMEALSASMDLSVDDVNELLDRAQLAWERIQAGHLPPPDSFR